MTRFSPSVLSNSRFEMSIRFVSSIPAGVTAAPLSRYLPDPPPLPEANASCRRTATFESAGQSLLLDRANLNQGNSRRGRGRVSALHGGSLQSVARIELQTTKLATLRRAAKRATRSRIVSGD